MTKLTKTQHIKNIIQASPNLPAKEVALRANCDLALVYQVIKGLGIKPTVKTTLKNLGVTSDLVYEMTKGRKDKLQPPEVSIKKACEVLINLVKDINGLDILLFDATIRLDHDGTAYECASDEVESIVKAIVLLQKHRD